MPQKSSNFNPNSKDAGTISYLIYVDRSFASKLIIKCFYL